MSKLLHLEASPRKERAYSVQAAAKFLEAYHASHPDNEIETVDLWRIKLPELNHDTLNAKYKILHGLELSAGEAAAWAKVTDLVAHFKDADHYLWSLPMWNFGLPYKLKHFLDVIIQPGLTFGFSPENGYSGLVVNRPAVIIAARGGEYSSTPVAGENDFQLPYLEHLLRFIGFTDIKTVKLEPTLKGGVQGAEAALNAAGEQARVLAEAM